MRELIENAFQQYVHEYGKEPKKLVMSELLYENLMEELEEFKTGEIPPVHIKSFSNMEVIVLETRDVFLKVG